MRRHPILLPFFVVCSLIGLFFFAQSFEYSPTLARLQNTKDQSQNAEGIQASGSKVEVNPAKSESMVAESVIASGSENQLSLDKLAAGKPIMGKMPNETIRAEVGRAGWKMLHTILAQYPEKPNKEEKSTLETYIKLFSRVYPCQECALHFQELLKEYPPQVSSRKAAIGWGCNAHNQVNKRLNKPEYNCTLAFEDYDCGCGGSEDETSSKSDTRLTPSTSPQKGG